MARKPSTYNFRPNALFRAGPDFHLNACVGENGGPYDLRAYGQGFFDGGKAIIEAARTRRAPVDILVYPAAFSFRHGIELYLKHLLGKLITYNQKANDHGKNRGIADYFDLVAQELGDTTHLSVDPVEIGIAKDIINDFNQIDPTGQVFRYPEDLKGNLHLTGINLINVEILDEGMAVLRNLLEKWIDAVEQLQWESRVF